MAKEHVDEFKSVKKFKIFNTNNLWIKLDGEGGWGITPSVCLFVTLSLSTDSNNVICFLLVLRELF